jgi:hypothetical protein
MTVQEQFDQLILERSDKEYFNNKVVLYQKIFEKVKDQVDESRSRKSKKLQEKLDLAFLVLKSKAEAWGSRNKDEFTAHINKTIENQKDFSYKDNPYTDIYLKYLLEKKERLGY